MNPILVDTLLHLILGLVIMLVLLGINHGCGIGGRQAKASAAFITAGMLYFREVIQH